MNNWIVLLTTCISPSEKNNEDERNYRIQLYERQIRKWLHETNLHIFLIENSDYTYDTIKHKRFHPMNVLFDRKYKSSSQYEARSILYAIEKIKETKFFIKCTHILKVTGRYFLKDIENELDQKGTKFDLYLQNKRDEFLKWQNTEYYGIRKEYIEEMVTDVKDVGLMEHCFFHFTIDKNYTIIGPFPNDVPRSGDGIIYEML
jgi:hypothetical protein